MDETKFVVIEMQNGNIGSNYWPYTKRVKAETKFYQVLAEVVESTVAVHTVVLMTGEGFVIDSKCYKHGEEPEPEPEPTTDGEDGEDGATDMEGA